MMTNKPKKPKEPFAVQAAKFSWVAPLVGFAISFLTNNAVHSGGKYKFGDPIATEDRIALGIGGGLCLLLIALGLAFAIIALMRIKQHGKKGILGHAIAGLIINGLIFALFGMLAIASLMN